MRLIDADMLKKNIFKWLKPSGDPQETEMVRLDDVEISVISEIDEQPTAYDIDKVVEELERFPLGNLGCQELNEIIEIVKQGGVSDDVCEWHCDEY